jgi:uncharacterized protein YbaP (TraB family)
MKVSRFGWIIITLAFLLTDSGSGVRASEPVSEMFWSVSNGQHHGYLLGTIHSEDPRVLDYTEDFTNTLADCATFAMELVPNLPTLAKLAKLMNLAEGKRLVDSIGEQRFEAVVAALSGYGLPTTQIAQMKPWAAMMTLSVPPPTSGLFMDFSLSLRAAGNGNTVVGLETLEQQIAFLENMPLEQQLELLDQALAEFGKVQEVHDRMVALYLSENLDVLLAETDEQLAVLKPATKAYFIDQGIVARNQHMLETLLTHLPQGCVFTAVGALHLAGPKGLLALLKANGYTVEPLASPFTHPTP